MKHLLTITCFLLLASLSVSAQEQKEKNDYKDYTPCAECFENWRVSEGSSVETPSTANTARSAEGSTRKPFKDTYVGQTLNNSARVIVGTTLMIVTAVILTKATKPTIQ